jgi:iron complex transport system permease protein
MMPYVITRLPPVYRFATIVPGAKRQTSRQDQLNQTYSPAKLQTREVHPYWSFPLLFALFLLALVLNLCAGETSIAPGEAINMLFSAAPGADASLRQVLWDIRLPRLLAAAVVGCSLGVSGYLLQTLSRNFLADPYLTGVSSGAGLAVAAVMLFALDFAFLPVAALTGGMIASVIAAAMARTAGGISVSRLLLAGIAISAICSSLITLLVTTSGEVARAQGVFYWLAGSLAGANWVELQSASAYVVVALVVAMFMTKPLRLLSLGSQTAASLGLNVARSQWIVLSAAVVLCGTAVSLSGIVGFVGLIAPQIARRLFGRDERSHVVASAASGAVLVLLSDLCARLSGQGQELPLGTLLSLIGGPFFLWMVLKRQDERE